MINTLAGFALAAAVGFGVIIGSLIGMSWVENRLVNSLRAAQAHAAAEKLQRRPARLGAGARSLGRPRVPGRFAAEYHRQHAVLQARMTRGTRRAGVAVMSVVVAMTALAFAAMSVRWTSNGVPAAIDRGQPSLTPALGQARTPTRRSPRRKVTASGNRQSRTQVRPRS